MRGERRRRGAGQIHALTAASVMYTAEDDEQGTGRSVQIFGGYGYIWESEINRLFRATKAAGDRPPARPSTQADHRRRIAEVVAAAKNQDGGVHGFDGYSYLLRRAVQTRASHTALIFGDRRQTWKEFHARVTRLAGGFARAWRRAGRPHRGDHGQ